jgi:hypothetical protein
MRTPLSSRGAPLRCAAGLAVLAAVTGGWAASAYGATTTTTTPRPAFSTASGTVAALSTATSSMEVQNPTSGQVTVSWTSSTRFSETVTVSASQLLLGDCVTVTSSSKNKTGPIAATLVSLRPSTNGSCTGGAGFGFGGTSPTGAGGFPGGPGGAFGARSFPRGTAPGGTFPRLGSAGSRSSALGRFATGEVVAKTKSSFEVKGFALEPPTKSSSTKSKDPTSTKSAVTSTTKPSTPARKTVETRVTFNAKTEFTTTETASAANLAVGICATALGPANDIGVVAATTISIRPAPKSGCPAAGGFGGFVFAGRGTS